MSHNACFENCIYLICKLYKIASHENMFAHAIHQGISSGDISNTVHNIDTYSSIDLLSAYSKLRKFILTS